MESADEEAPQPETEHEDVAVRKNECNRKPPSYLQDYDTTFVCANSTSLYLIIDVVSCDRFSANHKVFLAAIAISREPKNFAEVMKDM